MAAALLRFVFGQLYLTGAAATGQKSDLFSKSWELVVVQWVVKLISPELKGKTLSRSRIVVTATKPLMDF
jgi:hypothetical protein